MKIARYWEKASVPARLPSGKTIPVLGWGWSENNREEAQARARASAQRAAGWLESKTSSPSTYGYFDRPPREEIIHELQNAEGETIAVITRNSYGVQVLNTQNLMFIDIDVPEETAFSGAMRKVQKLFGKAIEEPELEIRRRIIATAKSHSEYSFRLYRTAAGFRCVLMNRVMNAKEDESRKLLNEFSADVLYQKLCRSQECYRARLTPKFWRCGARRPPNRFPWDSPQDEQQYRSWQREYEAKCRAFAVCRFIETFGAQKNSHGGNQELQMLIALHDKLTQADSNLKLA